MNKKKVLVVDDQRDVQLLLRKRLETEGYDVVVAQDGVEGLATVIEHKPDLILTDVVMPNMDGIEFFKKLKSVEGGETVPVIVISKRALMKDCFDENEIEGFFAKPFDMNALIERVQDVFKKQDVLETLEAIEEQEKEKFLGKAKKNQDGGQRICKRCGKQEAEDVDYCSRCGSSDFVTQDIDD